MSNEKWLHSGRLEEKNKALNTSKEASNVIFKSIRIHVHQTSNQATFNVTNSYLLSDMTHTLSHSFTRISHYVIHGLNTAEICNQQD